MEAMKAVTDSMTTLNKFAAECCRNFEIHACTDGTGFSFLGHLHEMMDGQLSCHIYAGQVPVFEEAFRHADDFLLTAAGHRYRNFTVPFVQFEDVSFAMEVILFDPQTSGGLLISLAKEDAPALLDKLKDAGLPAEIVGEVLEKTEPEILVTNKFKNAPAFLLRDARHAMHDILLLRISAILPEAISDGGLTPPLILIYCLPPTKVGVI